MTKIRYITFFGLLLLLAACGKNFDETTTTVVTTEPETFIRSSFEGRVVDENREPISSATVEIGGLTTTTDPSGRFKFGERIVKKSGDVLKVNKSGYFDGFSKILVQADNQAFVEVTLLNRGNPTKFISNIGGVADLPGGGSIVIDRNTLTTMDGRPFRGEVSLYARWFDPSDPNLTDIMPGALLAIDENGNDRALSTFGMIHFEMEDAQGQPLTLNAEADAQLNVPMVDGIGFIPEEMPSWFFDEDEAIWVQDDICKRQGDKLVVFVGKPGTWNCDVPIECAPVCGWTLFQDSTIARYLKIEIEDQNSNFRFRAFSDTSGFFRSHLPINTQLDIRIEDDCENLIYESVIGPFMDSTKLDTIYTDSLPMNLSVQLIGQLNDCMNAGVSIGQIGVRYPGFSSIYPTEDNGAFDFNFNMACLAVPEIEVTGYDVLGQAISPAQTILVDGLNNLGTLTACQDPISFVELSFNNNTFSVSPAEFQLEINQSQRNVVMNAVNTGGSFFIRLTNYQGLGSYTQAAFLQSVNFPAMEPTIPELINRTNSDFTIEVTQQDNEFIEGTIDGTIIERSTSLEFRVSGGFKCRLKP
ncbi:MAG: carboxypeptidase-like regulatory domain-containing protein [Bacteroidota bacterium]